MVSGIKLVPEFVQTTLVLMEFEGQSAVEVL